jgi:hypothetical protein
VNPKHPITLYLCPACQQMEGRPHSVVCKGGQKVIHLVCDVCQHQWEEVSVDAPVLFSRSSSEGQPPD